MEKRTKEEGKGPIVSVSENFRRSLPMATEPREGNGMHRERNTLGDEGEERFLPRLEALG